MSAKETTDEQSVISEPDKLPDDADSVASLMGPPLAVFNTDMIVADVIEKIRAIPQEKIFTYGYVLDSSEKLTGVLIMRRLLTADPGSSLGEIM